MSSFSLFAQSKRWVGTWATAQQLVESHNMPPLTLTDNTLRQIVRVSIGGDTLRLKLSNEFSSNTVEINEVQIAVSKGGSEIDTSTIKSLTFEGRTTLSMNEGTMAVSDPIAFDLKPRMDLAITIYYGYTSATLTGHPISCTLSYILIGNALSSIFMTGNTATDHWYNISAIDVLAPDSSACIAVLGNSITDGLGSTLNLQNRWTDHFSEALLENNATNNLGILNMGITGNCVLNDVRGTSAAYRYDRDILKQSGIRYALVCIGVNDIGRVYTANESTSTANKLINAYKQFILMAHANNVRIYGATILPFNGSVYYNPFSDSCRNTVNQWIRTSGYYDDVIDFDKVVRSSSDTTRLISSYLNDGLHPDVALYSKMGHEINLDLFSKSDTTYTALNRVQTNDGYSLEWIGQSKIEFVIPANSNASLRLFNIMGTLVKIIPCRDYSAGKHSLNLDSYKLPKGVYICTLKTGNCSLSCKMFVKSN